MEELHRELSNGQRSEVLERLEEHLKEIKDRRTIKA
jgi:hypothetical protein